MTQNTLWTTKMPLTSLGPPKCVSGWTEIDRVCYRAYKKEEEQALTWYDADKYYQHIGGHLASFRYLSSLKEVLLGQNIVDGGQWNYKPYWIGLNKIDLNEGRTVQIKILII